MNVLQIPIKDQFYQHAVHSFRDQGFASSKGYTFTQPINAKKPAVIAA
jgi:hypothetical protein